ncbi:MAG: hypothetical protein ACFCUO_03060 [Rhodospirillales bacterium]
MPFMLKIRWELKKGREAEFRANQETLCRVMADDHPGVICYHTDYPAVGVSEWTEIYATDSCFRAHLANPRGKTPLAACIDASAEIVCRCWGDPDAGSRELLAGFGTTYHQTAPGSFVLNRRADRDSPV